MSLVHRFIITAPECPKELWEELFVRVKISVNDLLRNNGMMNQEQIERFRERLDAYTVNPVLGDTVYIRGGPERSDSLDSEAVEYLRSGDAGGDASPDVGVTE